MYSRYGDNSKRPVRLPEHYGGSAFSPSQQVPTNPIPIPKREPIRSFSKDGVGEKVSPVAERLLRADSLQEKEMASDATSPDNVLSTLPASAVPNVLEESIGESVEEASVPPSDKKTTSPFMHFEGLRRLLGGNESEGDQDRLLLLGLILLLSRAEGDSDILLWLSLLLLCG